MFNKLSIDDVDLQYCKSDMGKALLSILIITLLGGLASCTKNDCPTGYLIKVTVKDKNYFNADQFSQLEKKDETLPFHQFIKTVYYTLRDTKTGNLVYQSDVVNVEEGKDFYPITVDGFSAGEYELTVWGNRTPDVPSGELHYNGQEQTDIYVARTILSFPMSYKSVSLALERAKGKLVIFCSNFPAGIGSLSQKVSSIYETVDSQLEYTGEAEVNKEVAVNNIIETYLAPTSAGKISKLNLNFFSLTRAASSPTLTLPEMEITIHRNEITAVKVDYNIISGNWEIWLNIDGEWIMVHHLSIK